MVAKAPHSTPADISLPIILVEAICFLRKFLLCHMVLLILYILVSPHLRNKS